MMKLSKLFTLIAFLGVIDLGLRAAEATKSADTLPKIGFFSEEFRYGDAWRKYGLHDKLRENGLLGNATPSLSWVFGTVSEDKIYNELKKYHAVVISLDRGYLSRDYAKTTQNYRNAIRRYLEQGGGVLLVPQSGEYKQDRRTEIFNIMFGEYGVTMLREGIYDPKQEYSYEGHPFLSTSKQTAPSYLRFFRLSNIKSSPVTEGVKNLFMPLYGAGGMWGTIALKFDPAWDVVVRGDKTAASYRYLLNGAKNEWFEIPGSYASEPPVAAIRTFGKGRLAVISCNLMHLTINAKAADWPGVFEFRGDGKTASDGHRLLFNTLRWLSEGAAANPALGSYVEKPAAGTALPPSVNYDRAPFPAPARKLSAGLIGIHSALSDGSGTVREFADAARRAGLDFIAFTESLEKLTPEKYEQLKRECKEVSDAGFYACPGIEFPTSTGLRWAFWGEAVRFPGKHVMSPDGKSVHWWGQYAAECDRRPSALLNYDRLHQIGDPGNLWWYFRIPLLVYRDGKLQADNVPEYLFALNDIRGIGAMTFCGVDAPGKVAEAASSAKNVVYGPLPKAKDWLNSKNTYEAEHSYVSQAPLIRLWNGINVNNAMPFDKIAGSQRVRLKFDVESPDGIAEVKVIDGTRGLFRRFDGHAQKKFSAEFDAVHDRVHPLVLEVTDVHGKKAWSQELRIQNPFYAITRCSDNLNLLGYSTLTAHPDRHSTIASRDFEDTGLPTTEQTSIAGVDTAGAFVFTPVTSINVSLRTDAGEQSGGSNEEDNWNAQLVRYPVISDGVSIITSDSPRRVDTHSRHLPDKRISYGDGPFYPLGEPQPIADIGQASYLLRSRIRPDLRHTRPWLSTDDYRGSVMLHEITLQFKKDTVLKGSLPIRIASFSPGGSFFNASRGYWTTLLVEEPGGKIIDRPAGSLSGEIANGGFITVLSKASPRRIVLIPSSDKLPLRYEMTMSGTLYFGLGKEGERIAKGETVTLRLAFISQLDNAGDFSSVKALPEGFDMDGKHSSLGIHAAVGKFLSSRFIPSFEADNGAMAFTTRPLKTVCDLPFRVNGIEDNGCAAYFEKNGSARFLFAPVQNGSLYFQTSTEKGADIWCGNVFLASDRNLKLTLTVDGQTPGKPPKLEIHNPTAKAVRATVFSPASAPMFGGIKFQIEVPAGTSIQKTLEVKR